MSVVKKQRLLNFSKHTTAKDAVIIEIEDTDTSILHQSFLQELVQARDHYLQAWASKCSQSSDLRMGGGAREDVDLDSRGIRIVEAFRHAAEMAAAQNVLVPPEFLDILVLVIRNDCNHSHSHVSRMAHAALCSYVRTHPYARLAHYEEGTYDTCPYVINSPRSAWLPIETDRSSFSSKYLLVPDMSISARNWKHDHTGGAPHKRQKDSKWGFPFEIVQHCLDAALQSADRDDNGSLLLLHYVLEVVQQDLDTRLQAHAGWEVKEQADGNSVAGRRRALLQNSLAWRIFDCSHDASARLKLVESLIRIISGVYEGDDTDLAQIEEEEHEDSHAGACAFTRRELSALAARMLRMLLSLYGRAESAGYFLAVGSHRASNVNLRIALDADILKYFWSTSGVCKTPAASRALLRAMPPRDALRMLGLVVAQKFSLTFAHAASSYMAQLKDIKDVLCEAADILNRGSDIGNFFEVDVSVAIASLSRDPERAVTTYRTADHIAVLLGGFSSAAAALVAAGEAVPCGDGGLNNLKKELSNALNAVVGAAKQERNSSYKLSKEGVAELAATHMAFAILSS